MSQKRKQNQKPKSLRKRHASQPDITPDDAIKGLKSEILDEVRLIAAGKKISVYELVGLGKELLALERTDDPPTKKTRTQRPEPELTVNDL